MPKKSSGGGFLRPRRARDKARREQIEAQAFRVLQTLCKASAEWAMRYPAGSVERDTALNNALHLSLLVNDAHAEAKSNPEGSEGIQQKAVWLHQIERIKGRNT